MTAYTLGASFFHMFVPAVCQISTTEKLERFEQMWWTASPFPHQSVRGKPYSLCNTEEHKQENYIKINSLVTTATLMDLSTELVSSHCVPVEAYCTVCTHMPWSMGYVVVCIVNNTTVLYVFQFFPLVNSWKKRRLHICFTCWPPLPVGLGGALMVF